MVFDGKTMEDLSYILEVESLLFDDIKLLLDRAREVHRNIDDSRHPSYYVNPKTGFQEKLLFDVGVSLSLVEQIFEAARQYVTFVEESLKRDPERTGPWIFR